LELGNRELDDDYYARALLREEMNAEDLQDELEARCSLFYAYVAVAVVSLLVLLSVVFVVA
jgi:hypothetical protein